MDDNTTKEITVRLVLDQATAGWIIGKFATRLAENLPKWGVHAEISEHPSHDVDINHSMLYHFASAERYKKCTVFITHVDDFLKLKLLKDDFEHRVDVGVCMSRMSVEELARQGLDRRKLCYIPPAHDGVMIPRRIIIGITSRVYSDGRKREDLLVRLASTMKLEAFHFEIIGKGWDEVIDRLEAAGATVRYYPGTSDDKRDHAVMLERIPTFDYYLYTGLDEGSMGLLDALAVGAKSIVTPQGFHLDIKDGITLPFWNFQQLRDIFSTLARERQSRIDSVNELTWDEYARRHAILWRALLRGDRRNFADLMGLPVDATVPPLRPSRTDVLLEKAKFYARWAEAERRNAYRVYRSLRVRKVHLTTNTQDEKRILHELRPGAQLSLRGKRIVLILESLRTTGAFRAALRLARHMNQEQEASVQIWALSGTPGLGALLCDDFGIRWRINSVSFGGSRLRKLSAILRFTRMLRLTRPDVILPFGTWSNVLCGLVWRLAGAQLCIWNQQSRGMHKVSGTLERFACRRTPWFVADSEHEASLLLNRNGISADRICLIRAGVEVAEERPDRHELRKQLGLGQNAFVGCLLTDPYQRVDYPTLLKAWRLVVDRLGSAVDQPVLVLAGLSPETCASLKILGFELDLSRAVQLLGEIKSVAGLLSSADIGLSGSTAELAGLLECMGAGLAIVSVDSPLVRQLVGEQGSPFLAPPGDAPKLADCILQLANAPSLRGELGNINMKKVAQEFSSHRACAETVKLIALALAGT